MVVDDEPRIKFNDASNTRHPSVLVFQSNANLGPRNVHPPETLAVTIDETNDGLRDFIRNSEIIDEVDRNVDKFSVAVLHLDDLEGGEDGCDQAIGFENNLFSGVDATADAARTNKEPDAQLVLASTPW